MESIFRNSRLIFNPLFLILFALENLSVKQDGTSPVQILSIWVASCFALRVLKSDHPSSSKTFFELTSQAALKTKIPTLFCNFCNLVARKKKCQRQSCRLTDRLDGASYCTQFMHFHQLIYINQKTKSSPVPLPDLYFYLFSYPMAPIICFKH